MNFLKRLWSALTWPPVLVLLTIALASAMLPNRYRLFEGDMGRTLVLVVDILAGAAFVSRVLVSLKKVQRLTAFAITSLASACACLYFVEILARIARSGSDIKGGLLLEAAILVWVIVFLTFALWYWLLDDGRDFFFPQYESEKFPDWKPEFLDYLFLGFSTSTAFSPTDVLPASRRMKALMMAQAALSLSTISIAAARAVNIL